MRRPEVHGISTNNTVRRTKTYEVHHGKGVVCKGGPRCWLIPPKNGGLCMTANVKWGYAGRKNSRKFHEGFDGGRKDKCSYHGHRMCHSPVPADTSRYKKRSLNQKSGLLDMNEDYDLDVDEKETIVHRWDDQINEDAKCFKCDEFVCKSSCCTGIKEEIEYGDEEIKEEIEYGDSEAEDINNEYIENEREMEELDNVYLEYKKMRDEEIDFDNAYTAYNKMKDDEWVILESEN